MGQHTIVEKLRTLLSKRLTTEIQVVYFLVGIRKLLEHENKKETFPVVNFYGNWAVHARLSQSPIADRLVKFFDDLHQRMEAGEKELPISTAFWEIVGWSALQQELAMCLRHFDLPSELCTEVDDWKSFVTQLIRVIEDSPLHVRIRKEVTAPIPTQFVKSVSLTVFRPASQPWQLSWKSYFHTQPTHKHRNDTMTFHMWPEEDEVSPTPPQP